MAVVGKVRARWWGAAATGAMFLGFLVFLGLLVGCEEGATDSGESGGAKGAQQAPQEGAREIREALAAHRALHEQSMERLTKLTVALTALAEGQLEAGVANQRVEELAAEAAKALDSRRALATPEAVRALYVESEPGRKERYYSFVAVNGRLRDHSALLLRAQKVAFDIMNATRFDAAPK